MHIIAQLQKKIQIYEGKAFTLQVKALVSVTFSDILGP